MADKTKIQWTDATWNVTTGCSKVSQGCAHCYAERQFPRVYGGDVVAGDYVGPESGLLNPYAGRKRKFTDVKCHEDRLDQPLRWKRPRRVFVCSMGDLFHDDVPDGFIDMVFTVMQRARQHTFQVLTKRPEKMMRFMQGDPDNVRIGFFHPGQDPAEVAWPPRNVWLGVSVEDQDTANERIPLLLQTPAAVRFVSAEPLLVPVDLNCIRVGAPSSLYRANALTGDGFDGHGLDWIIVGGESGPKARPMHPHWARSIRDQCKQAGVPFFFKQWGAWMPIASVHEEREVRGDPGVIDGDWPLSEVDGYSCEGKEIVALESNGYTPHWEYREEYRTERQPNPDAVWMARVGKKRAGNELDGQIHEEYPETP